MTKLILSIALLFAFSASTMDNSNAVVDEKPNKDCLICCAEAAVFLDCPNCHQEFCRACAEQWIGAEFSFTTNYLEPLNVHLHTAPNNACPFCKQDITREYLQSRLTEKMPGEILGRPKSSTERLRDKTLLGEQQFSIATGTVRGCGVPVVIFDDVRFAVIDRSFTSNEIDLDFEGYNLIVLHDLKSFGDLKFKAVNLYVLSNLSADGDIVFDTSEKLIMVGATVHARKDMYLPPDERQVLGVCLGDVRQAFIEEFESMLRADNKRELVSLMSILVGYDNKK